MIAVLGNDDTIGFAAVAHYRPRRGRVEQLIEQHTDGRFLGLIGEPGVNIIRLNGALDEETGSR